MANGETDINPNNFWIDMLREGSRAVIGIGAMYLILKMFKEFVALAEAKDKIQVILLIAGQLATLAAAMVGFYFGGAMRPIRQGAAGAPTGLTPAPIEPIKEEVPTPTAKTSQPASGAKG